MDEQKPNDDPIQVNSGVSDLPAAQKGGGLREVLAQPSSFGASLATILVLSLLISLATVIGWDRLTKKEPRFGTVDIGAVLDLKQVQLSKIAFDASATDKDRAATFKMIESFGRELEDALSRIRESCQCMLLVRNAVVTGSMPDYTENLKTLVGVDKVDPDAISKMVTSALQDSMTAAKEARK
jgi:hypothetical protein